jgi:hypothetical protein
LKKKITYLFFLPIAFCQLLSSCYSPRYVYSPVAHNVPVLVQKGDSKLAFQYANNIGEKAKVTTLGKESTGTGIDVQGAYAITNHLAVQAAYAHRSERNFADFNIHSNDTSTIHYTRNLTEFGIGYYTFLNGNSRVIFQVFGGAGLGKSSFTDEYQPPGSPIHTRYFNMDVTRLYLQPALMIRYKNTFATSISSRISCIYFRNVATDYSEEELANYRLKDLGSGAEIFWEPAFVNTFGFKKLPGLQFELQLGMAFLLSERFVDYRTFNLSAGVVLDIPKLFSNKRRDSKN